MESSTTRSIAFNNLSNLISCQMLKKASNEPFKPTVFLESDCVCKCVGVCVCFTEIPFGTSNKTKAISFCSVFFHHWQGHDLISNKMFSLCSIASHVCGAAAPRVFLVCTVLYTTIHLDLT